MLKDLTTEGRNPASEAIDALSPLEIVRLMNAEDARVAAAVGAQAEPIARAIEQIADRLRGGGRLIYFGAGTSGRLGVLDATECPPTFNSPPEQVQGLIAGGPTALTRAVEGAEDRPELAIADLQAINLSAADAVVGIATSGRTPYVIGGLRHARSIGAFSIALVCNDNSPVAAEAELAIAPIVGPEILSGSTRLKAGTATKLVLNMLTTGAMIRLGKTYGNLMVDLRATNTKLRDRAARIVASITGSSESESQSWLDRAGGEVKTAIVLHRLASRTAQASTATADEARRALAESGGQLRLALECCRPPDVVAAGATAARRSLLLGIDGGGTGTVAILARRSTCGPPIILGRGTSGPANPQVVGFDACRRALDLAVSRAFAAASLPIVPVVSACLALAGAARDDDRSQLEAWAGARNLAETFQQVHDALPVLAAGTPHGWGVALIAGTGSLAYGRNEAGETARAGGWGYLFGDEGSAYRIALDALRAVAMAADGRGPATELQPRLLGALGITSPQDIIAKVYGAGLDRASIAALAPEVTEAAAAGDAVAASIVDRAGQELAAMVVSVAQQLNLSARPLSLALAGSVLTATPTVRLRLEEALRRHNYSQLIVQLVPEPALGALTIAANRSNDTHTTA